MPRPLASLSLDLDNLWSYMKVHGDAGWEAHPTYLDLAVERALSFLARVGLRVTVFVVGQDAALPENRAALARIAPAGHEVGNHSFHHEPWLHRYAADRVADELERAETAIAAATGVRPTGFRGPGFSVSETVLRVLAARGYRYDASTLPTFIGPLARAYYFLSARLEREQREERSALFGTVRDGLRPVGAYRWDLGGPDLLEIPVTTFPGVRTPFHLSYVLYLSTFSRLAARAYFRAALETCRATGVEPSILLHPLDFLGGDEVPQLAFFPAMGMPAREKLARLGECLGDLGRRFEAVPMGMHADALAARPGLARRRPDFGAPTGGGT